MYYVKISNYWVIVLEETGGSLQSWGCGFAKCVVESID